MDICFDVSEMNMQTAQLGHSAYIISCQKSWNEQS